MANVVVSLYYYLMVVKAAYLDEPPSEPPRLEVPRAANLLAGTMVALVIAVGIFPTWFLELSRAAAAVLVK
jgi:NADH-quinone oxidoreductase subunit N